MATLTKRGNFWRVQVRRRRLPDLRLALMFIEEDMLTTIMQYTGVPSLTGLPALAVPCGFDSDGLPVGMQLIGKPFDEATLFRVGAAYQALTDFHRQAPPI